MKLKKILLPVFVMGLVFAGACLVQENQAPEVPKTPEQSSSDDKKKADEAAEAREQQGEARKPRDARANPNAGKTSPIPDALRGRWKNAKGENLTLFDGAIILQRHREGCLLVEMSRDFTVKALGDGEDSDVNESYEVEMKVQDVRRVPEREDNAADCEQVAAERAEQARSGRTERLSITFDGDKLTVGGVSYDKVAGSNRKPPAPKNLAQVLISRANQTTTIILSGPTLKGAEALEKALVQARGVIATADGALSIECPLPGSSEGEGNRGAACKVTIQEDPQKGYSLKGNTFEFRRPAKDLEQYDLPDFQFQFEGKANEGVSFSWSKAAGGLTIVGQYAVDKSP